MTEVAICYSRLNYSAGCHYMYVGYTNTRIAGVVYGRVVLSSRGTTSQCTSHRNRFIEATVVGEDKH